MSDTDSIRKDAADGSPQPRPRRLRDVHAQATRAALVAAARACFVRDGWNATTLDGVALAAGTTKGAVYHHFKDKKALFHAVYESLSQELVQAIVDRDAALGPGIQGALRAFLMHAANESYRTVLFTEGPGVLGSATCREIDLRYSLGLLHQLVEDNLPPQVREAGGTGLIATLMLALVIEAGHILAETSEPAQTTKRLEFLLARMLSALG
ncbi:MAG: TetR/AcrR family transcriptional regulator [Aquabacterium sp.]|jgi:AcrR family transcriptional regulator|nr:MAG: TetR/AcrR family transcriptional regulator [Aquabacterium sp.]